MVGALLCTIGEWWNRLTGRKGSTRTVIGSALNPSSDLGGAKPDAVIAPTIDLPRSPVSSVDREPMRQQETGPIEIAAADPIHDFANDIVIPLGAGEHAADVAIAEKSERHDTEQSLAEVLCLESLPVAVARPTVVDPDVRDRTLASLGSLRQIPALQSLAQGFLRAMNRQEVAVTEVVTAIEKDSALCVRVLRMANSVLVSPERRIEDLETAVQMLGVARVRKAAQALFTLRDANRVAEGFDWRHLWIHALGTAAIAEELEQQFKTTQDSQIHLAALLHDVGKIVLSTIAPDAYRDVLIVAWNENGRLEDLERERLGVDHREAGVLFAKHNGLPAVVVESIAHHNRPEEAVEHRFEVALVTIANYLSKAHGLGFSGSRLDERDGEFADLSAWDVIEETCGFRPDPEALEDEMHGFIGNLRAELKSLREES
jgi:putative nucleotidyltransferase with HDIG domain